MAEKERVRVSVCVRESEQARERARERASERARERESEGARERESEIRETIWKPFDSDSFLPTEFFLSPAPRARADKPGVRGRAGFTASRCKYSMMSKGMYVIAARVLAQ